MGGVVNLKHYRAKSQTMVRSLTAEKQVENALKSILIPSGGGKCNPKAAVLIGYSVNVAINNKHKNPHFVSHAKLRFQTPVITY